jgi:PAS domain S-box-containing protein
MADDLEIATLRASEERQAFLLRLSDALRPLSDPLEMQATAARLLGEHLQVNRVGYAELGGRKPTIRREWICGVRPLAGRWTDGAFGDVLTSAFRRGEVVVVSDVGTDPRFSDPQRAIMRDMEIAAFAGVMLLKGGRLVAAFGTNSATPRNWTSTEVDLIRDVAERTWEAVERARAESAVRGSEERLAFLLKLSDALRPLSDPVEMTAAASRLLGEHLKANRVAYADIEGDQYVMRHIYESGVAILSDRGPLSCMGAAFLDAYRRGEAVAVDDARTDTRLSDSERAGLASHSIAAFAMVAMLKNGLWVSALGVHSAMPRVWTEAELDLIRDVAERVWEAVERVHTGASLRLANQELRESEERFAAIHDLAPFAISLTSVPDGRIVSVNDAFEQLFEFSREEVLGKTRVELGISTPALNAALVDELERNRVVRDFEVRRRTKSDAERVLLLSIDPVNIAGKDFLLTTVIDVTEKKHAEALLRERELRLRLALDAAAAGSWSRDGRSNQVDWDDRFRALYGIPADAAPKFDTWLSRVHKDDLPQIHAILDDMKHTTKNAWDCTFRVVRADGTVSWIQSLGRAERGSDGQVVRLTGLDLDVTGRREAEKAREARRDEERDRELRLLLETATQGIVSIDSHGLIMTANRALETMFGWDGGAMIGQPIERLVPTVFREPHTQIGTAYFADPRPLQLGVDSEVFGQRKDGTTFPIEISLSHASTPGGGRVLAFVADVTARKRAEAALHERTLELERRTAQLRKLASDLTLAEQHAREQLAKTLHDGLQQLLVSASMNLDRQVTRDAQNGPGADDLLLQAKGNLDEAINAARSLSFELFPPVLHGSGLPAALTWLADWMRHQHGLVVHVSADPLANSGRKDVRTLLFESVRELLFNTVKHARVDRAMLDLSLGVDNTLRITVEDRGIGFDPVKLVDEAKDGQVGWGLFSIRERLTLLGGRLDVESAPGQGTRFRLIVPNGNPRAAGIQRSSSSVAFGQASLDLTGAPPSRALRIVIVDDHAAVRKAFREMLQERHELRVVGEAANGIEAIAVAHAVRPDIILMDVSMPEMDGVEATRRIRAELPFIQILGLSTHLRGGNRHAIEEVGAVGFFTKGLDTQRLIEHLIAAHAATALGLQGQAQ